MSLDPELMRRASKLMRARAHSELPSRWRAWVCRPDQLDEYRVREAITRPGCCHPSLDFLAKRVPVTPELMAEYHPLCGVAVSTFLDTAATDARSFLFRSRRWWQRNRVPLVLQRADAIARAYLGGEVSAP